jgi:maleylacetate reductase
MRRTVSLSGAERIETHAGAMMTASEAFSRWRFSTPQQVISGGGALAALPGLLEELGAERAFVLSTRSLRPHLGPVEQALGGAHRGTFTEIGQHTPAPDVEQATARAAGADVLISFGGGSVIDAAKAVAYEIGRPPQVAVPTTLSSGEFTPFAGITDPETRRKGGVYAPEILPHTVIHDAALTRHTPEALWLSTGMRAMDHALETLWARSPHPYADTLAAEALRLLWTELPASRDPANLRAREACLRASWFSVSGIMNVGTRLSHPIGHQVGSFWDVPHGVTSCIALPAVMRHLAPVTQDAQRRIAEIVGVPTPAAAAEALEQFIAALDVPTRLRETGAVRAELPLVAEAVREELAGGGAEPGDALEGLLEQMW